MESDVNIKEGYKKTAVGVIPEEWEVKPFNESFKHLRAYTVSRNELNYDENKSCIYNIHYGDIHSAFPNSILDVEKNIKLIPVIINPELETPELLKEGDLIMADASEDYEGIGKTIELLNVQDRIIVSGTHTFPLRPITKFAPKYAGYIFTEFNVHKQIKRIATGISVFGVSKANISKIQLPIPPFPEQKAIADCLTTWDSGIEKLSALIKAKKELKRGLMQQLLTGEKRLDGFEGEWEYKRISDISEIVGGGTPSTTNPNYWNGEISWFTPTEIKKKFVGKSARRITEKGLKNSSAKLLPPGTILLTTRATIGEASIAKIECSTNQGFQSIVCTPGKANNLFLYDFIKFNKKEFIRKANGSTFLEVSKKEIQKIQFKIPCYEEQTSIANVLTTADKEITLLEKKLEGFKEQKRGLMQVLLTGERRLIN